MVSFHTRRNEDATISGREIIVRTDALAQNVTVTPSHLYQEQKPNVAESNDLRATNSKYHLACSVSPML